MEVYDTGPSASTPNGRASYSLAGHISNNQRFRGDRTCPICKGSEDEHRGNGTRCYGFLSSDGEWCHCTREDHAGHARLNPGSNAYQHLLKGKCPCGTEHAPAEPKPARPPRKRGTFDKSYPYVDEAGRLVFEAVRWKDPKGFSQRRPDGKGKWAYNLAGIKPFLYRLPELIEADPAALVVVVEGEKDVDRLRSLGFVSTCNPMGAGKWRAEYASDLKGRRVAILPDNDKAGRDHAQDVSRSLVGVAAEVKVVELPGLPEKGDVSDFLDGGGTAEDLRQIIEGAPIWAAPAGHPDRPVITVTVEAHEIIGHGIDAIATDPEIYQRSNMLVRVVREPIRANGFKRPPGAPRIASVPTPTIFEKLTRFARWNRWKKNRDGTPELVDALPPDWVVMGVSARADWPTIRPLESVVEAPTLRPDGSILDTPGYDERTGLLYIPNAKFPAIPDRPTPEDARRAVDDLLSLVVDFPFARMDDEKGEPATHRSAWLAALLTVVGRFAIDGPCPLFLIDATTPGAGKSLLADLLSLIPTGRAMARTAYPDKDEEMRKRITSIALAGDRVMLLDNIASAFGSSALDAALTGTTWKDRMLARLEMTPELPLFTVWCGTGNNVQFKGDMLRRVVHCRLEPTQDRPEERDPNKFAIKEPLTRYALNNRARLVVAALTILRAYVVAGRPDQKLTAVDYREWSDLVRSAVHWAAGADPCASRKDLTATDTDSAERAALVEAWAELPGADRGVTTGEALKYLKDNPAHCSDLRALIANRSGDLPSTRSLGMKLSSIRGRFFGNRCIRSIDAGKNTLAWKVEEGPGGGTSGTSGTSNTLRAENCTDSCNTKLGDRDGFRSHQSHQSHRDPPEIVHTEPEIDWAHEPAPPLLNDKPGLALQFVMQVLRSKPLAVASVARYAAESGVSMELVHAAAGQLEVIRTFVDGEEVWDLEQGRIR